MMDQLTDDCQWLIIKYLKLEDQLALWEASEHSSNRLNENIINAWQRQSKFELNTQKTKENPKFLNILLRTIGPTVQQLILLNVTYWAMEHWCGYSFPNLQHLTYDIKNHFDNMTMKLMVELFPGLTSLCPIGFFDCSIAAQWTQLRKLDLTDSYYPDRYPSFSQFQMLEEISFIDKWVMSNFSFWEDVLCSILNLPRLQTLNITVQNCTPDLINYIILKRGLDIQKIIFNGMWNFHGFHLKRLKNLRQLTLGDDDDDVSFELEQLQSLVSVMPYLEQLDLVNFELFCSEIELWQTVSLCPALNVLNISGAPLDYDFLAKSRRFMMDVLSKRSSILTLCCYDMMNVDKDLFRQNFQHSKLKLTFEPACEMDFRYFNYCNIQFVPLKT